MNQTNMSTIAFALAVGASAMAAQAKSADPLSIERQGYMFAGGKYSTVNDRQVMVGQLYAEFQIPSKQKVTIRGQSLR
jgi:hypothetical protein